LIQDDLRFSGEIFLSICFLELLELLEEFRHPPNPESSVMVS